MKSSIKLGMLAMMMAASSSQETSTNPKQRAKKDKKKIIPKGLKEFFYGENSLYALNQKNADRKAKTKGFI